MNINKFEYISNVVPDFDLPIRSTTHSAGYDIHSPIPFVLEPGETIQIPLNIKVCINPNQFLMIVPRSSLGFKYHLVLDNTVGIIDADYYNNPTNEGMISAKLTNMGTDIIYIKKNDRILQGIFVTYDITSDDNVTDVRQGGFGSTGI